MTTELEQWIRAGLREYADAPVITPPPVEAIADRRPFSARGPLLAPLLAAAAVMVVVVLATIVVPAPTGIRPGSGAGGSARIPRTFAPFSFVTGDLAAAPIDRAVAAYVQRNDVFEDWGQDWQLLVLDADGTRYRRTHVADPVPAGFGAYPDGIDYQPFLLSPDGRRVAIGGGPNGRRDLSVLDVSTGEVTRIELAAGENPRPLAWSPDGHQIAYVTTTPDSGLGPLTIIDVVTGEDDPRAGNVSAVAFSPDGSRFAVQDPAYRLSATTTGIMVFGSGPPVEVGPVLLDMRIAGSAAWSPDGHLLAMIQSDRLPDGHGGIHRQTRALRFISVDGRPGDVPADIALDPSASFIGWRGDSVVIWDGAHVVAIPVDGRAPTTLVDTGAEISTVQLASGLLSTATVVEPGPVDRGPWPQWARLGVGVPVGVVLAAALGIGWWLVRRRPRAPAQLSP